LKEQNMDQVIRDEKGLRDLYKEPKASIAEAWSDHLEETSKRFIALSPMVILASGTADGTQDMSPKGGAAGFVHILDNRTLLLPDSAGNNKLHTFRNLVERPGVGLMFMIPGVDELLRVRGQATLSTDLEHLAVFADDDRPPKLVVVIKVDVVFPHCAKAFKKAGMWDASTYPDRDNVPGIAEMAGSLREARAS
jgi:uncharacterized protein